MTLLLAVGDLTAGGYLLGYALRREQRDKDAVLAVGVVLVFCAVLLAGLAAWGPDRHGDPPPRPTTPGGANV